MIPGNDLSPFQPNPDFPAYFRTGERFTLLKCNEGSNWPQYKIDWYYAQLKRARGIGFLGGPYAYLDNSTTGAQAYALARKIAGEDLIIWGDVEYNPLVQQMPDAEVHAFHQAQIRDIGQTGTYGLQSTLSRFPESLWWVAAWGRTPPAHKWTFWQKGMDGFGDDGDMFNGDAAELAALFGGKTMTPDEVVAAAEKGLGLNPGDLALAVGAGKALGLKGSGYKGEPVSQTVKAPFDYLTTCEGGGGGLVAHTHTVSITFTGSGTAKTSEPVIG